MAHQTKPTYKTNCNSAVHGTEMKRKTERNKYERKKLKEKSRETSLSLKVSGHAKENKSKCSNWYTCECCE